ncbi:MAG TPA: isochorismatase family cysteine hydrolase [Methanoregulaceae archaeon]|nr:isochorismatase family cysteine hydrolase [Methanoregulaceae archaeon]
MTKTAFLIIDMQNDFILDGAPLQVKGAKQIIENIKVILGLFRSRNLPVFHVLRIQRTDGSDVEVSRRELFRATPFAVEGTSGAEVIRELAPHQGEYIIRKNRMSAFLNTDLDLLLRSLGIERVVIAGIQTPNCIRTTVFDAFAYNYHTILVDDAVAAQTEEIHKANVLDMANIGIEIIKTKEVESILKA